MANIHDVARAANVSISTVSRVVNNDPAVHPALRVAVEEAVRALGYRPNAAARSLRLARSDTVGVLVFELANPALITIVQELERVARARGVSIFLCESAGDFAAQGAHLERLLERRVDGVIVHPFGPYHAQIAPLREAGIPVLVIGQHAPSSGHAEIVVDEQPATREAYRLLFQLGHRRIAVVGRGDESRTGADAVRELDTGATPDRIAVYRAAHAEAGLPVDRSLIRFARDSAEAYTRTRTLLARPDRPTALLCGVHSDTPDVLIAVRDAGLRIPEDLSLIVYGDSRWAEAYDPALTVIRRDYPAYGRLAASKLFDLIDGRPREFVTYQAAELVVRASCAAPANVEALAS